jgi:hypothetical protein
VVFCQFTVLTKWCIKEIEDQTGPNVVNVQKECDMSMRTVDSRTASVDLSNTGAGKMRHTKVSIHIVVN